MASRLNAAVLIGMLALLLPHCLGLPIMATQQCQNMTEEHRGLRTFGGLDASVAYMKQVLLPTNSTVNSLLTTTCNLLDVLKVLNESSSNNNESSTLHTLLTVNVQDSCIWIQQILHNGSSNADGENPQSCDFERLHMQCMVRRAIVAGESSREAVIISLNETGWPMSQGINLPCHSCRWVNSSLPEGDLKSDLDRVLEC